MNLVVKGTFLCTGYRVVNKPKLTEGLIDYTLVDALQPLHI